MSKIASELLPHARPPANWILLHELAAAKCYVGEVDRGVTITQELLNEDLPDWLRGHVMAIRGWALMATDHTTEAVSTLEDAIEHLTETGHFSSASIAAQTLAISSDNSIEGLRLDRFEHAIELAEHAMELRLYPRALMERSISTLYYDSEAPALEDARIAARLGPWSPGWMRATFAANYAIVLAHNGRHSEATDVLDEVLRELTDDDAVSHLQVQATRCLLAAHAGREDEWDTLVQTPLPMPVPPFFALLGNRAWTRHGDSTRAAQADDYFAKIGGTG